MTRRYQGDGRGKIPKGMRPRTKPGRYGTLYRYRVAYRGEERDPAAPDFDTFVWAYDEEHALEKVTDPDQGWEALSASRLYE